MRHATYSLLWLRDTDSQSTRQSISTVYSENLDLRFDFDQELLGSRAYHSLFKSFIKRKLRQDRTKISDKIPQGLDSKHDARINVDDMNSAQHAKDDNASDNDSETIRVSTSNSQKTERRDTPGSTVTNVISENSDQSRHGDEEGDAVYPCKGCGEVLLHNDWKHVSISEKLTSSRFQLLEEGKAFELGE